MTKVAAQPIGVDILVGAEAHARGGQPERAIELLSRELAQPRLSAARRVALHVARARSFVVRAEIAHAEEEVGAAEKIAAAARSPLLRIRAQLGRAYVLHRTDRNTEAEALAADAVAAARKSRNRELLASALLLQAQTQAAPALQTDDTARLAEEAAALFESLGQPLGQGRALRIVAAVRLRHESNEENRAIGQRALALARASGDRLGEGTALNALFSGHRDLAIRLRGLKAALQIFIEAGELPAQASIYTNLALTYARLGLYHRARRMVRRCLEIKARTSPPSASINPTNIATGLEILLGHEAAARESLAAQRALHELHPTPLNAMLTDWMTFTFALWRGEHREAIARGRKLARAIPPWGQSLFLSELAEAYLGVDDRAAALRTTTRATKIQQSQRGATGSGFRSNATVWWIHHLALKANRQRRLGWDAARQAYALLVEGIGNLTDEGLRRSYLHAVEGHAELLHGFIAEARKRGLPAVEYTSHLDAPADLREPVERLVDVGLRLNALRAEDELHEFLIEEVTELFGAQRVLLVLEDGDARRLAGGLVPRNESAKATLESAMALIDEASAARSTRLVHLPVGVDPLDQRSILVAPLVAQQELIGYLYCDIEGVFGRFHDTDHNLLSMLAAQAAMALANVRWAQGLEAKVDARTAELALRTSEARAAQAEAEQRAAELAVINSIQQGIAGSLDFQGIVDLVGDKLRDVFGTGDMSIRWWDEATNVVTQLYTYEHGVRLHLPPAVVKPGGVVERYLRERRIWLANTVAEQNALGVVTTPGTDAELSVLIVPLLAGDRMLGAVTLSNHERENAFTDADVRLVSTIAASMAVALLNAKSYEAERQRAAELAIINAVQQALAGELDMKGVYDAVGDRLRDVFSTAALTIAELDHAVGQVGFPYAYEHGQRIRLAPGTIAEIAEGRRCYRAQLAGQAFRWNTQVEYRAWELPVLEGTDMSRSGVGAPIMAGDRLIGAITVENHERDHAYGEADERLLTTLAASMGVAIQNTRLFEAERQRAAELETINDLSQVLATRRDLQSFIDLVGDKLRAIFNVALVFIALYDRNSGRIYFPFYVEEGQREYPDPIPLGDGLTSIVIQTRKPLRLPTFEHQRALGVLSDGRPAETWLGVPIFVGEEVIGVVSLQSFQPDDFPDADVRLLTTLTANMGVALDNARLFEA